MSDETRREMNLIHNRLDELERLVSMIDPTEYAALKAMEVRRQSLGNQEVVLPSFFPRLNDAPEPAPSPLPKDDLPCCGAKRNALDAMWLAYAPEPVNVAVDDLRLLWLTLRGMRNDE